jgi:hypothetical protein
MTDLRNRIDEFAQGSDYKQNAEKFLNLDRWTGDDPILMLADAAGTTTGQNYFKQVKPSVEAFRDAFLKTGRIDSMDSLSKLDPDDDVLTGIFGANRKRRVLIEGAGVFADMPGDTELHRLQRWARNTDPLQYSVDPFGQINGVGLRTFQYLRMVAGIDTVKPDIQVKRFVEALAETTHHSNLDPSSDQTVLESCQWISSQTDYRMIELDQIAWWHFSDATGRHAGEEN